MKRNKKEKTWNRFSEKMQSLRKRRQSEVARINRKLDQVEIEEIKRNLYENAE